MLTTPFLTDLDSRAAVKGSRDPLGVQSIWAGLGRRVVGNLTTVTTSVRDFTTVILGYYIAERIANEHGGDSDLAVFLKWEQLAAYARGHVNNDWGFRGVRRAQRNLQEPTRILVGLEPAAQILSNQKIYGLWGLFTVPSRSSGLVEGDPTRLTLASRELVERVYLPILSKEGCRNADPIVKLLTQPKAQLNLEKQDRALIGAIAKVLQRRLLSSERSVYQDHLLLGGPRDRTHGAQAVLAGAMESMLELKNWILSPTTIRSLARECRRVSESGDAVAAHLDRIRTCEALLAPAEALFDHLLGRDGQTISEVAAEVKKQWGSALPTVELDATTDLEADLRDSPEAPESAQRWLIVARALATGDYETALRRLIEHNSATMRARAGAAAWVQEQGGKIQVRFRDDTVPELPKRSELPELWRNPYFIPSLRSIAAELRG